MLFKNQLSTGNIYVSNKYYGVSGLARGIKMNSKISHKVMTCIHTQVITIFQVKTLKIDGKVL